MKKEQNTYVMEIYKFNIRFNEEDKEKWKLWSIHLAKFDYFAIFPCSLVFLMFIFFCVTNLSIMYINNPILRMLESDMISVRGYLFSIEQLFWVTGIILKK